MLFPNRDDESARFRFAQVAGCALVTAALALSAAPAFAGCNSGNTGSTDLLGTANCQADASGVNATAVGLAASATALGATAVGRSANAAAIGATAVGNGAFVTGTDSTAVGGIADATGNSATAVGRSATAATSDSTSVGVAAGWRNPKNTEAGYIAIGSWAGVSHLLGHYSITIGSAKFDVAPENFNPRALGAYSIAIGGGDGVSGNNGARANSDHAVAIGTGAVAQGLRSLAVGAFAGGGADASNQRNAAFGHTAGKTVTGNNNLAMGANAGGTVVGSFNAAFGDNAGGVVTGTNNLALGRNAGRDATASNTIAIGTNAKATANQAVAIGNASQATVANTVSVGSASVKRRIMNVANGVSANDAVNLAQAQALVAQALASVPAARSQPSDDLRRELAELRALVKQQGAQLARQQLEIAELRNGVVAAGAITD